MMTEADPSEILLVDKNRLSAKRLHSDDAVQEALSAVGSIQNITLTRLARNRRILFVEGVNDFVILRRFARHAGLESLATSSDITVVESEGFSSWERIKALSWGFRKALGKSFAIAAVFDRDFWSTEEILDIKMELSSVLSLVHFHERKEIENYMLVPNVLDKAINRAVQERIRRGGQLREDLEPMSEVLKRITEPEKTSLQGQYLARRLEYLGRRGIDAATVSSQTLREFEKCWGDITARMKIVDGGDTLRALREEVQRRWKVSLTDNCIVDEFARDEIPTDILELLNNLESFRTTCIE